MKIEKQNRINQFLQYFVVSKPFKIIFTDFSAKKQQIEKLSFLRGEPYFFKINKYSFAR